jgi:NACalpha-BTF3-like transcription factor
VVTASLLTPAQLELLLDLIALTADGEHGSARADVIKAQLRASVQPEQRPVITAEMVRALAAKAEVSFQAAKDALVEGKGDMAAAERWARIHRWPR